VRKVIRRGNFASLTDLQHKLEAFIDYFNRTMAKPFKMDLSGQAAARLALRLIASPRHLPQRLQCGLAIEVHAWPRLGVASPSLQVEKHLLCGRISLPNFLSLAPIRSRTYAVGTSSCSSIMRHQA